MYNFVSKDPVTIVDDILVATDGWELCLLVRLIQQERKWFSSSLALGTNVVANKTDRLSSDIVCYLDRANVSAFLLLTHMVGP